MNTVTFELDKLSVEKQNEIMKLWIETQTSKKVEKIEKVSVPKKNPSKGRRNMRYKPWSQAEDQTIRRFYATNKINKRLGRGVVDILAKKLGRTSTAVKARANTIRATRI